MDERRMIRFDDDEDTRVEETQDEEQKIETRLQVKHVTLVNDMMWQRCGGGRRRLGKKR